MDGGRSQWLDNAKGVLMILVIWGHLIERLALTNAIGAWAYGAIYLFHIPAFAMVSGMVSRAELGWRRGAGLARKLLVPLLLFQGVYLIALERLAPHKVGDMLEPHWLLWFLLSLFLWRLMLPVFAGLRFPVAMAVGIALAAGFVDAIDKTLSLSRTFVFFPAFLIGHVYRQEIRAIAARPVWGSAIFFAVLACAAGYWLANGADIAPFYGSRPYSNWSDPLLAGAAQRLVAMGAGIVAAVGFLTLIPRQAGVLNALRRWTMPVFLLHGLLVLLFWAATPPGAFAFGAAFVVLAGVLAVLIAFGLAGAMAVAMPSRAAPGLSR